MLPLNETTERHRPASDRGAAGDQFSPGAAARRLAGLRVTFIAGTLGQGGAERQLFYILKALRESGAAPRLLSLSAGEFWQSPIEELGVPVTWVGQRGSKVARLGAIVRELRRHPPEIVQSQHFYTNLYAWAGARLLGVCAIGAIRNTVESSIQATGALLGRWSLHGPERIAANSQGAIREALKRGIPASRLALLPNVVDTVRFTPGPPARRKSTAVRLLAVGRLVPQKRFDRFLEGLARLQGTPGVEVIGQIAGFGPLRDELERQAADLGLLPGRIEFLGPVPDLRDTYQSADVLVLTSDFEGTPNVVLEAMACGLPVVATRVGGLADLIHSGHSGVLVDAGDQESLTNVLAALIADPDERLRIGRQARAEIVQRSSFVELPRLLAKLYGADFS